MGGLVGYLERGLAPKVIVGDALNVPKLSNFAVEPPGTARNRQEPPTLINYISISATGLFVLLVCAANIATEFVIGP